MVGAIKGRISEEKPHNYRGAGLPIRCPPQEKNASGLETTPIKSTQCHVYIAFPGVKRAAGNSDIALTDSPSPM
ncbi:hypothetical protein V5799_025325 [Amblyomma americanum]|uniref:Uncharacterized protein n=1 Tax=Amblyomma americanum TaxID=6943 RepID=A0AAQ4EA10_AMBAM